MCCPVGTPGNENSRGSHKQVYWILLLVTFSTLITGSKWRRVVSEVRVYMRVYASVGARGLHRLYIIYNLTLWSACKESDRSACRAAKEIPSSLFFESRWEPTTKAPDWSRRAARHGYRLGCYTYDVFTLKINAWAGLI